MPRLLHELLDAQASRRPDAVALVHDGARMTYAELSRASDLLASRLRPRSEPGDRICFLMPKSITAIVAMLGILKAGCVYVPMDPASPPARLARVMTASDPRWLLVSGAAAVRITDELLAGHGDAVSVGWLDGEPFPSSAISPDLTLEEVAAGPLDPRPARRHPSDAAHILFTSGSTGQPKGVVVTHQMVTTFLDWALRYFGMGPDDQLSGHSPLHFDLSTFDVFGAFAAGATLHLVPAELNLLAPKLAAWIRDSQLTQWFSVPSILSYLARFDVVRPDDFPSLRRLVWCGETFPTPALRYWMGRLPHVTFTNLYGPTEATIASSHFTVPEIPQRDDQPVPIGTACAGERLMVLDGDLHPVAPGTTGDLYIAGAGLSPGYWRDQGRTDETFRWLPGEPPTRAYRTGDLAHEDPPGLFWFHGRSDQQIKSRGYRIELGEIEAALDTLPMLRESAVVATSTGGFEGSVICCAYVPAGATTHVQLRSALARLVPGYMLPSRWLAVDRLPRNVNGKVDRPALVRSFEGDT